MAQRWKRRRAELFWRPCRKESPAGCGRAAERDGQQHVLEAMSRRPEPYADQMGQQALEGGRGEEAGSGLYAHEKPRGGTRARLPPPITLWEPAQRTAASVPFNAMVPAAFRRGEKICAMWQKCHGAARPVSDEFGRALSRSWTGRAAPAGHRGAFSVSAFSLLSLGACNPPHRGCLVRQPGLLRSPHTGVYSCISMARPAAVPGVSCMRCRCLLSAQQPNL
jgi:hypothetical protein